MQAVEKRLDRLSLIRKQSAEHVFSHGATELVSALSFERMWSFGRIEGSVRLFHVHNR